MMDRCDNANEEGISTFTQRGKYVSDIANPLAKEYFAGVLSDFCQPEDVITIEKSVFGEYRAGTPADYRVMMTGSSIW